MTGIGVYIRDYMGVWNVHAKREGMVGVNESVQSVNTKESQSVSQSVRKSVSQ